MRGEEYWWKFSEYFSKIKVRDVFEDFKEFLRKYNRRFLKLKIRRVERAKSFIESLSLEKIEFYSRNLVRFVEDLSKTMGQRRSDKTITFSAKIFGYCYRISFKKRLVFPFEIDIPLDSRIRRINPDIKFWRRLSRELGIPPLHLDSIVWILSKPPRSSRISQG